MFSPPPPKKDCFIVLIYITQIIPNWFSCIRIGAEFLDRKSSSKSSDSYSRYDAGLFGTEDASKYFKSESEVKPWFQVQIRRMEVSGIFVGLTGGGQGYKFQNVQVRI